MVRDMPGPENARFVVHPVEPIIGMVLRDDKQWPYPPCVRQVEDPVFIKELIGCDLGNDRRRARKEAADPHGEARGGIALLMPLQPDTIANREILRGEREEEKGDGVMNDRHNVPECTRFFKRCSTDSAMGSGR